MSQRILLVDDNLDLIKIVQIILKGQGYETFLATTIEEAVTKIKVHQPALILLDVFICDEDGREFCSRLKAAKETGHIKIIMMSGDDDNLGFMAWNGADDFLSKPFDFSELVTKVQKQLAFTPQIPQ